MNESINDKLYSFVHSHLKSVSKANTVEFQVRFGSIRAYYNNIELIYKRFIDSSDQSTESTASAYQNGIINDILSGKLESEKIGTYILEEKTRVSYMFIDIESFYLFTNILLDNIFLATQYVFGNTYSKNGPGLSFDGMKELRKYCTEKELDVANEEIFVIIDWLQTYVSRVRGNVFAHKNDPKSNNIGLVMGLNYNISSEVMPHITSNGFAGITDNIEMMPTSEVFLMTKIFILVWLIFIDSNSSKFVIY